MVKVPIMTEIEMPSFEENDRTDLVIGVGEFYGRNGNYPRTDLGRWLIETDNHMFGIYLESNGTLSSEAYDEEEKLISNVIKPEIEKEANRVYSNLMNNKYQPLFEKYGLKDFYDVIDLNINQKGLKEWIDIKWKKDKIDSWIDNDDLYIQIGNLGMYIHKWEKGNNDFCCRVDYYLDFPGDKFRSNLYGGSQSKEMIEKYGYKINMKTDHCFNSERERFDKMEELYEDFSSGKIVE